MSEREGREDPLSSPRAEVAVLGAMLADGQLIALVAEVLKPEDFFLLKHEKIFEAILRLERRLRREKSDAYPDHLTLAEELNVAGVLGDVGGPAYLMFLDQGVPLTHNALQYAETVRSLAERRRMVAALKSAADAAAQLSTPLEKVAKEATEKLGRASSRRQGLANGQEVLVRVLERSDEAQRENRSTRLIRTNLRAWDGELKGLPIGELTVVGAHPAVGKTSLLGAMAEGVCAGGPEQPPLPVSYHSLEDRDEALVRRFLASASGLAIRQLFEPGLTPEQCERREAGAQELHDRLGLLLLDDEQGQTVHSVASKIRRAVREHGVRVAFVDHLLEMVGFNDDRARDERVGEILRVLRDVARSEGIAVVLAVHLRRGKDEGVDYRYIRPGLQMMAGAEYVARMARLAVGLWFAKPLPEPKPPKPIPEPRIPKRATPDEAAEILEKWQEKKREAEREYNKELARWREDTENKANSIVCTLLKVTEGPQQMTDIMLWRIAHAGLVDRNK